MKMQKLGIEIRKIGSIENLYNDVDVILKSHNVPNGSISADMQVATVAHALQSMMQVERHFSICTIRDCAELCQVCVPEERMKVYRSIHCMKWAEMLPDYRQSIIAMVLDDFRIVLCP
jgi:hypothetical protein